MDRDEVGTLRQLKDHLDLFVVPLIAAYSGRTVKTNGDAVLAEFRSVVDAVTCAIAMQRGIVARSADVAPGQRIVFRIGINIGDVIVTGDDIYGNGVNVAARLESLCEPGGVCISGAARDQVGEVLPVVFHDRGEQLVKNVSRPLRVFGLTPDDIADMPIELTSVPPDPRRVAASSLPRLSIVVLPFSNFSNDPEQGFFADGVTEDLTTDLSRIVGSFVIARNTAYSYKDRSVDVRKVGRELGVRYVLEGSVRRNGQTIRLNAQLIEAETGGHIWADRFDGERRDLVAIQNEVTGRIARALNLELVQADARRTLRLQALDPTILDHIALGRSFFHKAYSPFNGRETRRHFGLALEADESAVEAMSGLAMTVARDLSNAWSESPGPDRALVEDLVRRALEADPDNTDAYYAQGLLFRALGRIDDGIRAFETGLEIDPNHYLCMTGLAFLHYFGGNAEKAIEMSDDLLRISPRDPHLANLHWVRGSSHLHMRRPSEAVGHLLRARMHNDQLWFVHYTLAAAYALSGTLDEAKNSLADMQRLKPEYNAISKVHSDLPYLNDPRYLARAAQTTQLGLQIAGLPLD